MSDRVIIFDTTLRDGEHSPGCSMNTSEKLEVAAALVEGVALFGVIVCLLVALG